MKKIILLLCFFTSFPFYSQIDNLKSNQNISQISAPLSFVASTVINYTGCNYFGTITINATGGEAPYTYSQDGVQYNENNVFINLAAGLYTTYVKDAEGKIVSNVSTISQPAALSFTALTINPTCVKKGSIIISATGGQEPYMYSKDGINYSENNNFSDLDGDTYTIYTKDNNECISMQEIVLYSPLYFGFSTLIQDVSCNGNNDGSITIDSVEMAFGPYTYSLDAGTPQSSNTFSNLSAGSYIVATRDTSTGCAVGYYITISEPPITLSISTAISNVSCSGNKDGSIAATVTGGKAPYFYSIDGADYVDSNTFKMLFAGTYSIKVKDSDGACSVMNNIIITEPKLLTATIVVENQTITINTTGGNGEYQYSFDQNTYQLGNIFNNASYGNHLVFVRDQNGCTMDISIAVYPAEPLINGENQVTVEFKPGQTLGDLVVEGQNIKWYNSANNVAKKTNKSNEATLPLSTLLVDGTTYYASQTINGIESTKRLAVTAKLNSSLATPDFTLPNFSYYPNPVQHTLSINN
ncbi:MAG: SprB repeat-containing protein, partial [Flavobacterium sp.]